MNLRTAINKLLDFEWGRKETAIPEGLEEMIHDAKNLDSQLRNFKVNTRIESLEKRLELRQSSGATAAKEIRDQLDSFEAKLNDLLGSIRTERLRITSLESNDSSHVEQLSSIRQEINMIKDRGAPKARTLVVPEKEKVLKKAAKRGTVQSEIYKIVSRLIREDDGVVTPAKVRTTMMANGDYNEDSVIVTTGRILRSIAWNHKDYYAHQARRGIVPQKHGAPTRFLSPKDIEKGWVKFQREVLRKKR